MKAIFVLFFWITGGLFSFSQDISKYLNDGIGSGGNNILKIAIDPLNGSLPLIWEHSFGWKFSIEAGAGPVLNSLQNRFYPDEPLPVKQNGVGFTVWVRPKFYLRTYPERFYVSIYPRLTIMDHTLFWDVAWFNIGYQRTLWNRLVIAGEFGAGFRFYKNSDGMDPYGEPDNRVHFILPVLIQFGYLF
jgi:hypothetical protein